VRELPSPFRSFATTASRRTARRGAAREADRRSGTPPTDRVAGRRPRRFPYRRSV